MNNVHVRNTVFYDISCAFPREKLVACDFVNCVIFVSLQRICGDVYFDVVFLSYIKVI